MVKARKFVLKHHFEGIPKIDDFELVEEELPEMKDGDVLIETLYLSVDPYMRPFSNTLSPPFTMIGQSVGKVVESKNDKFPVGAIVLSKAGWVEKGTVYQAMFKKS